MLHLLVSASDAPARFERSGDVAGSKKNLSEISRIREQLSAAGDPYWAEQVGIQEAAASAWVALAENNTTQAIAFMQDAANREDRSEKHIAMENRLSPMRELLGELLLQTRKPEQALKEFERSLKVVPKRFRSLAGAGEAAAKAGNQRLAQSYFKQLLAMAENGDKERPALVGARTFLNHKP